MLRDLNLELLLEGTEQVWCFLELSVEKADMTLEQSGGSCEREAHML